MSAPNRWRVIEAHYKLALLRWLPKALRSPYLRFTRRGKFYDCPPLSHKQIVNLAHETGFGFKDRTYDAMQLVLEMENPKFFERQVLSLPLWLIRPAMIFVPTIVALLAKTRAGISR